MKQHTTTQTEPDTALFTGDIADVLSNLALGDRLTLANTIRGGASPRSCFGRLEFFDETPYIEALSRTDYPLLKETFYGQWSEAHRVTVSLLLRTALSRGSCPMLLAALLALPEEHAAEVWAELTEMERAKLRFLIGIAQADIELKFLFKENGQH